MDPNALEMVIALIMNIGKIVVNAPYVLTSLLEMVNGDSYFSSDAASSGLTDTLNLAGMFGGFGGSSNAATGAATAATAAAH